MYSHHLFLGKKWDEKRYFRSLTKKTGDFGGRRQMEPPPRGRRRRRLSGGTDGARAFVDRFSTLVIQQLFWGTRVYRTSPLKN